MNPYRHKELICTTVSVLWHTRRSFGTLAQPTVPSRKKLLLALSQLTSSQLHQLETNKKSIVGSVPLQNHVVPHCFCARHRLVFFFLLFYLITQMCHSHCRCLAVRMLSVSTQLIHSRRWFNRRSIGRPADGHPVRGACTAVRGGKSESSVRCGASTVSLFFFFKSARNGARAEK